MNWLLISTEKIFDRFNSLWESEKLHRFLGSSLVLAFLLSSLTIEINRQFVLPDYLIKLIPKSHFASIQLSFMLLLLYEAVTLITSLARSITIAVARQFQIITLILLRDTFKKISLLGDSLSWEVLIDKFFPIAASAVGALLIFFVICLYYNFIAHYKITNDERDTFEFIRIKKLIALVLLILFAKIVVFNLFDFLLQGSTDTIFQSLFTLLVFSDMIIVLVSTRYHVNFNVAFRNSAFAVSTVFLRIALVSPPIKRPIIALLTAIFALGVTYAYKRYGQIDFDHKS